MNALKYNNFTEPTPIQRETLPLALGGRNVIGAAETVSISLLILQTKVRIYQFFFSLTNHVIQGSGKTLAFGIPMVQYIAKSQERDGELAGLVLTPTRELAIQVKNHIEKIGIFANIRVSCSTF